MIVRSTVHLASIQINEFYHETLKNCFMSQTSVPHWSLEASLALSSYHLVTFLARINRQETSFTNANLKKSQKDVRFNESASFNWWRQGSQTDPTLTNQSQKAFICVWSCLPHCFENIPRVGDCIMTEHQNQICGCQICWFGGYQNRKMQ